MPEITYRMATKVPAKKVQASGLAGSISILVVWILNTVVLLGEHQITGEIAAAITTIITFVVGYLVPPGKIDNIIPDQG